MPGFQLIAAEERQFDAYTFTLGEAGKETKQSVEGHYYSLRYDIGAEKSSPSALQVIRNYQNAARASNGKILWESGEDGDRSTTVRFSKGPTEIWIEVHAVSNGNNYFLVIIEKQAMQQDIALDASAMANDIANTGSVAIYGIHFNTAKSDLKPESKPALDEIAKLLKQNATLKVYIVGHTDMVGDAASNVKLSQARAQSVVNALLSQYAIAAARLVPYGAGPYAPVGSNKTEEGRAKNRRVELVEIATK